MTSTFYSHPNHDEIVDYVRFAYHVDVNNFKFVSNSDSSLGFDKCLASFFPTNTWHKIHSTWRCYHKAKRSDRFDSKYRLCGGFIKCDVCGFVKNHTSKLRTCCGQNLTKISCPARLIYVSAAGSDGTLIFLTSEHNHVLETNNDSPKADLYDGMLHELHVPASSVTPISSLRSLRDVSGNKVFAISKSNCSQFQAPSPNWSTKHKTCKSPKPRWRITKRSCRTCMASLKYYSSTHCDTVLLWHVGDHREECFSDSVDNLIQTGARSLRSDTESNRGNRKRYVDTNEGGFLQEGGFVLPETEAESNMSENMGHVVCSFNGDVRDVSLANLNLKQNNCHSIVVDEQGFLRFPAHGNTHAKPPSEFLQPSAEIVDDSCIPDIAQDSGCPCYLNVSSVGEISEAKVAECENSFDQSGKLKSQVENTLNENSAIPGCTSKSDICKGAGFNVNSFYSKHRRT